MTPRSHRAQIVQRVIRKTRGVVRRVGGPPAVGFFDYFTLPETRDIWGGPLNGQIFRQQLFRDLLDTLKPSAVLETGTFRGVTTEFLARTSGLPVYTVEFDGENFGFAVARLRGLPTVHQVRSDSRSALRQWLAGRPASDVLLVYLDAHWQDDLPARDEVRIIFDRCPRAVVVVDDFEVPGDSGYGFDDYGPGKVLTLSYLADEIARFGLTCFFPACPSALETGAKRGCVVLAAAEQAEAAASLVRLRQDSAPSALVPGSP